MNSVVVACLILLLPLLSISDDSWDHLEDVEDSQCTDNSCIKLEGDSQTFGFTREAINEEECRKVKNSCIKLRKCQNHCTLGVDEATNNPVNPCRLVVPLCQGINLEEYLKMREFKDNDPFEI